MVWYQQKIQEKICQCLIASEIQAILVWLVLKLDVYSGLFDINWPKHRMGSCNEKSYSQKLEVLDIKLPEIASDLYLEVHKYPKHKFIVRENIEIQEDEGKRRYIRFDADQTEYVELSFPVYGYLSKPLLQELGDIQILEVFIDDADINNCPFLASQKGVLSTLVIRNFRSFDSEQMYRIANQIYTAQRISLLKSDYLHKITHSYTITPTNELISHYSQLIFLEPVTISLSLLINNRRALKQPWTVGEFLDFMKQLVEGISILHKNWLCHNDIRPSNIFYCHQTQRYLLSGFSHVKVISDIVPNSAHEDTGLLSRSNNKIKKTSQTEKDYFKADIYDLGLTLLSAFFLYQPIDRKKCAPYIRELSHKYPILQLIKDMLADQYERASIGHIKSDLQRYAKHFEGQKDKEVKFIDDLSELLKVNTDCYRKELLITEAYKSLGILKSWKKKLHQYYLHGILADQSLESARYFEELAILSDVEANVQKRKSYYVRVAQIYHQLGKKQFQDRDYIKAITYFQKAVTCLIKINENDLSISCLKVKLSLFEAKIISGQQIVSIDSLQALQKSFKEIAVKSGQMQYDCIQQFLNIYNYYQNYFKIKQILSEAEPSFYKFDSPHLQITLQIYIITNLLKLWKVSDIGEPQKAIQSIWERMGKIKNEKEYFLIQNPQFKLEIHRLEMKLQMIEEKEGSFQRFLGFVQELDSWKQYFRAHSLENQYQQLSILQAEALEDIGDIWYSRHNDDQAYRAYSQAFTIYKTAFGSMYYLECGLVAEKLGGLLKAKGNLAQYNDCIQLLSKILSQSYGPFHKHALRLKETQDRGPRKLASRTSIAFRSSHNIQLN